MNADALASFAVRAVVGFVLGTLLGLCGFFLAWFLWPPRWDPVDAVPFMTAGAGIGSAMAGGLAWFRRDETWVGTLATLALAAVGGIGGAWGGMHYGRWAYDDIVVFRAPSRSSVIVAATIFANVLPAAKQLILDRGFGRR